MNLYYAVGGGLGHFSRAIGFIHTHPRLKPENTVVMVAEREMYRLQENSFADRAWQHLKIIHIPAGCFENVAYLSTWLQNWLQAHQPTDIFLDTFPAGIMGEWHMPVHQVARFHYIGRYLKLPAYHFAANLSFTSAYRLEAWHPAQEALLQEYARECKDFDLHYPAVELSPEVRDQISGWRQKGQEVWAVVHSEPAEEVEALLSFARDLARLAGVEPAFLLLSCLPYPEEQAQLLKLFPAYGLFPEADRIITGCGFNLMRQAAAFRHKHSCMPFPRRYDDQFVRFQRWKAQALSQPK
jgi:hypothetical protein